MTDIKQDLKFLVKGDKINEAMSKHFTEDIRHIIDNEKFMEGLDGLCDLLFIDRNGDGIYNGADLDIFFNELKNGIREGKIDIYIKLITCIGLLILSVPTIKIISTIYFEQLFIKVCAYILFVEFLKRTNTIFTIMPEETKYKIVDVFVDTYDYLKTSNYLNIMFKELNKLTTSMFSSCCCFRVEKKRNIKLRTNITELKNNIKELN